MMFELMPWAYMMMNEINTAMGRIRMATSALRKWSRNRRQTSATDQAFLE